MKVKPLLHCHLLVTSLLPSAACLPALETLLARAGRREHIEASAESWLCRLFGVAQQSDWPVAPFAALGDGLERDRKYWLRVDPVHFHLLRDRMVVADCTTGCMPDELVLSEAEKLIAELNRHFVSEGMQFFAPHANRWYLRLDAPPALQTYPLAEAMGQDANSLLPQGADAMLWHRRLNEIQMLLHEHPVNLAREQRGQLTVNSIWPWGGGVLVKPVLRPFATVWAEDPLVRGLAIASSSETQRLPPSATEWLDANPQAGVHLLVLDSLMLAGLQQNNADAIAGLERRWFAPLLEALRQGKMERLQVHWAQGGRVERFSAVRGDMWKFWRRPKPLGAFLND